MSHDTARAEQLRLLTDYNRAFLTHCHVSRVMEHAYISITLLVSLVCEAKAFAAVGC